MRYSILLFDADETLLDFHRAEREALLDALGVMGIPARDDMPAAYSAINDGLWKRLERGEIDRAQLRRARFSLFFEAFGIKDDPDRMGDCYTDALSRKTYLIPGALECCRALAAAGCRLYVITNGHARVQHGRFDASALRPYFLDSFISEEIGCAKPQRAFFDAVASRIPDYAPRQTLVVGDSLTSDIAGGIAAGLDTCWFNPTGKPTPANMRITYCVRRPEELVPLVLA